MTVSFNFYVDAGLTIPATQVQASQATDGASAAVDRVVYYGSQASLKTLVANSNPYVDNIVFTLVDSVPASGVQSAHVKLATSQAGLDGATAGAALNIGPTLLSGRENAIQIWMRIDTPALSAAVYSDITLTSNALREENS